MGVLLSIQQLIRNHHCCLAAEIHHPLDPIPAGATPGSHDNLSQRNIIIVDSDNPGTAATHTVQSTFEIKPSTVPITVPAAFGVLAEDPQFVGRRMPIEADELMIRWHDLPRDSRVRLYLPAIDADEVVAAAVARNGPPILTSRGQDTLLCTVGEVSWVPIPGPRPLNIPGLLSIELPPTVIHGQRFRITVHQVSCYPRRIIGAFQITIAVSTATEILPQEIRRLSVLRHIGQSIPPANRWHPIWLRLLDEIGDRVRGLGGDPDRALLSPSGEPEDVRGDGSHELEAVTGTVRRIVYDCFGTFEGFVIATCDGEITLRTCEPGIERVLVQACRGDLRVTVWRDRTRKDHIHRMAIQCC